MNNMHAYSQSDEWAAFVNLEHNETAIDSDNCHQASTHSTVGIGIWGSQTK